MVADTTERRLVVWQRQQVVEICGLMARPGQMLRYQCGLITLDQSAEPRKMGRIERLRTSDRHADAMQRYRMIAAHGLHRAMRRPAGSHVILGMDLEEAALPSFVEDRCQVLVFETAAGEATHRKRRKTRRLDCKRPRQDR